MNELKLNELTLNEIEAVNGGIAPLIGLGLAAFSIGYQIGKDLAA